MFPTTNIFAISILLMTNMTQGYSGVLRRFPDDEGGIADNRLLRRKSKSNLGLYIGIGGCVLAAAAGVGVFLIWKFGFSESEGESEGESEEDFCTNKNPCANKGTCSLIKIEEKIFFHANALKVGLAILVLKKLKNVLRV